MTKTASLTLNPTAAAGSPSATVTARAEHIVTDAHGRALTLKKPHFLAQFNMVKMLGNVPGNYISMVTPLLYLAAIGDDQVTIPSTPREVDAMLTRLDAHGYAALVSGIEEHFAENPDNKTQAETEVKNS